MGERVQVKDPQVLLVQQLFDEFSGKGTRLSASTGGAKGSLTPYFETSTNQGKHLNCLE